MTFTKKLIFFCCFLFLLTALTTKLLVFGNESKPYFYIQNPKKQTWIKTEQDFTAIAIEFLDQQDSATIKVSANSEKTYKIFLDEEDWEKKFSDLVFIQKSNFFWVNSSGRVNIHLYNSKIKKPFLLTKAQKYIEDLPIISRAGWGADETIRYDYNGINDDFVPSLTPQDSRCQDYIDKYPDEYKFDRVVTSENGQTLLWPRQYSKKIQKLVIHHTAESDKSWEIPGGDKIRSIYYYHAKTRSWGDIGYHFVIDQKGNIYEGRAGGDYIVGGHVYCSNINTIGIALMGNFMRNHPTKDQVSALAKLTAALSKKYNLDISATNSFHGKTMSTLVGHRDLGSTACPGDNLYSVLPLLRKHFSNLDLNFSISKKSKEPASSFSAQLSGKPTVIEMLPMSSKKITIAYKNTGKVTWGSGTWLYVESNEDNLWVDSIILDKEYVAANLREYDVRPGNKGHFDIVINTGLKPGTHTIELTPIINSERKINSATILFAVRVKDISVDYEFVELQEPETLFYYGQNKEAKLLLKNTGDLTWFRSGKFPITIAPPNNVPSPFADEKTPRTFAWLEEEIVKKGQIGTFVFDIHARFREGIFDIPFVPRIGDKYFLKDTGLKFTIKVKKPNYLAQILYDNANLKFFPGETKTIKLGLRNMSNVDWQENQISLRVIKKDNIKFQENNFYFTDFIPKNESGFIELTITAPLIPGKYSAKLQALANNKKFNKTRWLSLPLTVKQGTLEGKITYLSQKNISIEYKKSTDLILRVKNTGNITWHRTGSNAIRLTSIKARSKLASKNWKSKNIVTYMEDEIIKPNDTATFKFSVRKNSQKTVKEAFILKTKSLGKVENTRFEITIKGKDNVKEELEKSPNSQDEFLTKIKKVRNKSNNSFLEKLKKARTQKKQDTNNQQKSLRQILEERKKQVDNKNSSKSFRQILEERKIKKSSQKSSQSLLRQTLEEKKNQQKNNKNIRIKLSFPHDSINISCSKEAQIFLDNQLFKTIDKNTSFWARADLQKMLISVKKEKKHSQIIRIISPSGGIFKLINWQRSPGWNPDIIDNTFEGAIELRVIDDKMVVINDLNLEEYLRGIAEVPELEPHEKRKAMAILARSYARHYTETQYKKFPGLPYDGSDSPDIFQKYLGYNYSLRAPKWQKALKETEHEVIIYNDEILRTAYFSCSNGKTKTPLEAHWNTDYYQKVAEVYQSLDDSWGQDLDRHKKGQCGHGVGLSGLGASNLAKQGKTYQEILHYYYKNIALEKRFKKNIKP